MAMNLKEILETAAHLQKENVKAYKKGVEDTLNNKLEHSMSDAILNQIKADAFQRGIIAALEELKEVYGAGIMDTDIWAEYMNKETK